MKLRSPNARPGWTPCKDDDSFVAVQAALALTEIDSSPHETVYKTLVDAMDAGHFGTRRLAAYAQGSQSTFQVPGPKLSNLRNGERTSGF